MTLRLFAKRGIDRGRGQNMILAQLSDPHIVAAGKLFRCPMQGTAPNAARARREFDTAPYLARFL